MILGIVGWIVVGLLVGFIASKSVNLRGDDPRLGMGVAAGAAILAGILYSVISGRGVTPWNPLGLFLATLGGVAGVVIWHKVRSRYVSKEVYVPRSSY